jgi:hypothetical protein
MESRALLGNLDSKLVFDVEQELDDHQGVETEFSQCRLRTDRVWTDVVFFALHLGQELIRAHALVPPEDISGF